MTQYDGEIHCVTFLYDMIFVRIVIYLYVVGVAYFILETRLSTSVQGSILVMNMRDLPTIWRWLDRY